MQVAHLATDDPGTPSAASNAHGAALFPTTKQLFLGETLRAFLCYLCLSRHPTLN